MSSAQDNNLAEVLLPEEFIPTNEITLCVYILPLILNSSPSLLLAFFLFVKSNSNSPFSKFFTPSIFKLNILFIIIHLFIIITRFLFYYNFICYFITYFTFLYDFFVLF